jgi:hypothetical protein
MALSSTYDKVLFFISQQKNPPGWPNGGMFLEEKKSGQMST